MIGIGIDHDVTMAAVKAVRDAMDRNACFADYDTSSTQQHHRLHINLGVPSSKPLRLYPQMSSSTTTVVSPTHGFEGENSNGSTDTNGHVVGGVNVIHLLQQLFPKTFGQLLQPEVHVQVGGLHVPATTLDPNNRTVETYSFPSRTETNVVVASLLFIAFENSQESLFSGFKHPLLANFSGLLNRPLQENKTHQEYPLSGKVMESNRSFNMNEFTALSQQIEASAKEASPSSIRHGFHVSTTSTEPTSNDFCGYSRSFQNPIFFNKGIVPENEEKPLSQENQMKPNPFTSFDMLAHISVAMMNERGQAVNDQLHSRRQEDPAVSKSTDGKHQSKQCADPKVDGSRTVPLGNQNTVSFKKLPPGKTPKNHVRHFVRHSYRDFSLETPPDGVDREKKTLATSGSPFPLKLHETLSQIASDGLDNVIGWLPHGRSFKIHRNYEFVEVVLPQYFVMTKKSSFLRQLNLYGFRRISDGSYYHERFLRGMKFLCINMQRQKVNGNGIRAAGNPNEEPNFSTYPTCPRQPQPTPLVGSKSSPRTDQVRTVSTCGRAMERHFASSQPPLTQQVQDIIKKEKLQFIYESYSSDEEDPSAHNGNSPEESNDDTVTVDSSSSSVARKDDREQGTDHKGMFLSKVDFKSNHRRRQVSFPLKLQCILDQRERDGLDDVLSWLPHGRAFIVHDVDRFVEEILPLHFNQTKYSSFQRQCHMYHMLRITNGSDKGAYYHQQFQRGRPDLAISMTRTRVNGNGTRQPSNPNLEPNLYILPPLPSVR